MGCPPAPAQIGYNVFLYSLLKPNTVSLPPSSTLSFAFPYALCCILIQPFGKLLHCFCSCTCLVQFAEAKQQVPSLVLVNGEDLTPYRQASKRIFSVLARFGVAERLGMDEVCSSPFRKIQ